MNVKPRRLTFNLKNPTGCILHIENINPCNETDKDIEILLLFKVKRSEQKEVDFSPKFGKYIFNFLH